MFFFQLFVFFALLGLLKLVGEQLRRFRKLQQEIEELKHLIVGDTAAEASAENETGPDGE